jgi:hypothetical protein
MNEQTAEFFSRLTQKHEDWQVQQADRATKNILGVRSPLDK